jgi:chorismate lyase / 3-hydroxybenzoate synthase
MINPKIKAAEAGPAWPVSAHRIQAGDGAVAAEALPAQVLCAFGYAATAARAGGDARLLAVPLAPLDGDGNCDLWLSQRPVVHGWEGNLGYSEDGELLVVQLRVEEAELAPIEETVYGVYRRIGNFIVARGYPELWRVWHYLGQINHGEGDAERYRQLSAGRYRALNDHPGFEMGLPAATAIGSHCGGLTMIAMAGKRPGRQVENPRQVSAFRYPRSYGPRSPSFSRATLLPWADGACLLVSGTASIVGHATACAGDPIGQLRQTFANLQVLLASAAQIHLQGREPSEFRAESYSVYLRQREHLPQVLPELKKLFGDAPLQLLFGDICRRELLIEVEAVYRMPARGAA